MDSKMLDNKTKTYLRNGAFDSTLLEFKESTFKDIGTTMTGEIYMRTQSDESVPFFGITEDFVVQVERNDGRSDFQVYNKALSLKFRIKNEKHKQFFESLDTFGRDKNDYIRDLMKTNKTVEYKTITQTYLNKETKEDLYSLDFRFSTYSKNDQINIKTVFYDGEMRELKEIARPLTMIKTEDDKLDEADTLAPFKEAIKCIGNLVNIKLQFTLDFSIYLDSREDKYVYRFIPRIKFVQITPPKEYSGEKNRNENFVLIQDLIDELPSKISFKPEEKEMREKQEMCKVAVNNIVGIKIRLDDIVLQKETDDQYIIFPPEKFDSDLGARDKVPFTIPLSGKNLEFFEKLSETLEDKAKDIKTIFVNDYGKPKNMVCKYDDIYNKELKSIKFQVGTSPQKKTTFKQDGKILEYTSIDELREIVPYGSLLKDVSIVISKVFYNQLKKSYCASFRLVSCEVVKRAATYDKKAITDFAREGFEADLQAEIVACDV
jgi:hypothetical protein